MMIKVTEQLQNYVEEIVQKVGYDGMALISPDRTLIACGHCGHIYVAIGNDKEFVPGTYLDCDMCGAEHMSASLVGFGQCVPWAGLCKNDPYPVCQNCKTPSQKTEEIKQTYESQALISQLIEELKVRVPENNPGLNAVYQTAIQDLKKVYAYFTFYGVYGSVDKYSLTEFNNRYLGGDQ